MGPSTAVASQPPLVHVADLPTVQLALEELLPRLLSMVMPSMLENFEESMGQIALRIIERCRNTNEFQRATNSSGPRADTEASSASSVPMPGTIPGQSDVVSPPEVTSQNDNVNANQTCNRDRGRDRASANNDGSF